MNCIHCNFSSQKPCCTKCSNKKIRIRSQVHYYEKKVKDLIIDKDFDEKVYQKYYKYAMALSAYTKREKEHEKGDRELK